MPYLEISLPTGHREKVQVTNNALLLNVLEDVCIKRGLDINKCYLVHNKNKIDLAEKFSMSKLLNNAKLELIEKAESLIEGAEVDVFLQLPNNIRLFDKFNPKVSLWSIMEHLGSVNSEHSEIIFPAGTTDQPVIIHMHDQIVGEYCLRNTSLAGLGIRLGRVLFRLIFRSVDLSEVNTFNEKLKTKLNRLLEADRSHKSAIQPDTVQLNSLEDPRPSIADLNPSPQGTSQLYSSSELISLTSPFRNCTPTKDDMRSSSNPQKSIPEIVTLGELVGITFEHSSSSTMETNEPDFSNFKFPEVKIPEEDEMKSTLGVLDDFLTLDERECVFFKRRVITDNTDEEVSDTFFEITEQDMRQIIKGYRDAANDDVQLLTKSLRDKRREEQFKKYRRCIIQFHFPDAYVLQALFKPTEAVGNMYSFLTKYFSQPKLDVVLYTTPPKTNLVEKNNSLIKANLVPMAKVYVSACATELCVDNIDQRVFGDEQSKAQKIVQRWMLENQTGYISGSVPSNCQAECSTDPSGSSMVRELVRTGHTGSSVTPNSGNMGTKVPKWFKTGK